METHVIIIGLIVLIMIALPVYYINKSNTVNKQKIESIFKKYSNNNQFNFKKVEKLNKKVLAIDKENKGFILIDMHLEKEDVYFVDLNEINNCHLAVEKSKNADVIEKIAFEFENKTTSKTIIVPFYDVDDNLIGQVSVFENHQLAKKWLEIINETIK